MKVAVTVRGFDAIDARLTRLMRGSQEIAHATVDAGLTVLASAAKAAAPGRIGREIGKIIRVNGNKVGGVAGLIQLPQSGDGPNGPYGVFPDQGTRYMPAQHFVGKALSAATPRAIQAAKNAGYRTAKKIAERK